MLLLLFIIIIIIIIFAVITTFITIVYSFYILHSVSHAILHAFIHAIFLTLVHLTFICRYFLFTSSLLYITIIFSFLLLCLSYFLYFSSDYSLCTLVCALFLSSVLPPLLFLITVLNRLSDRQLWVQYEWPLLYVFFFIH